MKRLSVLTVFALVLFLASTGCTTKSTVERVYPKKKESIESRAFAGPVKVTFATVKRHFGEHDTIPLCLQIKNTSDEVRTLNYATGQRYDFTVKDKAGEPLWQWAAGKNFTLVTAVIDLKPGQRMTFKENLAAGMLKPGAYKLEAQSIADELYSETLELDITVE